jgi:hypothetical protein
MDVRVLSAEQSAVETAAGTAPDFLREAWGLGPAACILSALLGRPVSPDAVRDKAAGLGLLRYPGQGQESELTAKTLSRLFLAGFRIPAQARAGTIEVVRLCLKSDRRVFVCLTCAGAPLAFEAISGDREGVAPISFALRPVVPPDQAADTFLHPSLAEQSPFDVPMVIAARGWEVLSGPGCSVFGVSRDPDGTYHWDVAECATDGEGAIVRYY